MDPRRIAEDRGWTLRWGIHRHTLASRDTGEEVRGLLSLAQCEEECRSLEREFHQFGYVLWFAEAVGSEGERVRLRSNCLYDR